MFDTIDFYPTPRPLIDQMLAGIDMDKLGAVLEPSAGKGDIVDALSEKAEIRRYRGGPLDVDAVEINENLQHVLRGKKIRVIHDDFLTFQTFKRYSLIVMNPPFSAGDKHLLKALDMQQHGGDVVCVLNAETLRNPCTNTRKDLVRRLAECGATVEYIKDAFLHAEERTGVEIALIKVSIPAAQQESDILAGLRHEERYDEEAPRMQSVLPGEFLRRIVAQYNFEVRAGAKLISEYEAMAPMMLTALKESEYNKPIIKLTVGDYDSCLINQFVARVRSKYWEALFGSDEFRALLTSNLRNEFMERLNELKDYDFSEYNILQIRLEISRHMCKSVEDTILALFDDLSHKYHWLDETSKNIHYFNGWKTNQAYKINQKVIIPLHAFDAYDRHFRPDYRCSEELSDIEKVLNYLDDGRTDTSGSIYDIMEFAKRSGQTKNIRLKHFDVTFYKKGTCHIVFRDPDLLKKFNLFGSQRKGWLPPLYGKAKYHDMSDEEQAVVNEFEGEFEYARILANKEYFFYEPGGVLMLDAAAR